MNYNVGTFDLMRFYKDADDVIDTSSEPLQTEFLAKSSMDIICLQEFFNNHDREHSHTLIDELVRSGYRYYYTNPIWIDYVKGFFGVITFSKYPIIKAGSIEFEYAESGARGLNRGIFTDIVIGNDTIRVINVHLHSISIRLDAYLYGNGLDSLLTNIESTRAKMQLGFVERGNQVFLLEDYIVKSPFPVLLCGDFNDLPYSFTYRFFGNLLNNAHEKAGSGFGFTYNKIPWFIRIDHQFFDHRLTLNYCKVLTDNKLSDHYPVVGGYDFK